MTLRGYSRFLHATEVSAVVEWFGVGATLLIALGGASWTLWTWRSQRRSEQASRRDAEDFRYLNPFLIAADDLQSRIFNIVKRNGLETRPAGEEKGRAALELIHLIARYFAWVQLILRFTSFARDPAVLAHVLEVRHRFASNSKAYSVTDPWCLFRPHQTALGQLSTRWYEAVGFADTISIIEFEDLVRQDELAQRLGIQRALTSFDGNQIENRASAERLGDIQTILVCLLEKSEEELTRRLKRRFTYFTGAGSRHRLQEVCPVCGSDSTM